MKRSILLLVLFISNCNSSNISEELDVVDFNVIQEIDWQGHHLNSNFFKVTGSNIVLSLDVSDDSMMIKTTNLETGEISGLISTADLNSMGISSQNLSLTRNGDIYWLYDNSRRKAVSFNREGQVLKNLNLRNHSSSGSTRFILNEHQTMKFSLTQENSSYMFSRNLISITDDVLIDEPLVITYFTIEDFPELSPAQENTMLKRSPIVTFDENSGYAGFRYSSYLFTFPLSGSESGGERLLDDSFGTGFPQVTNASVMNLPDGSERRMYIPIVGSQTPYMVAMTAGNDRLYVVANGKSIGQRLQTLYRNNRTDGEPDIHILENSGEILLVYNTITNELLHRFELPFTAFGVDHTDEFLYFTAMTDGESRLIKTTVP